MPKFIIFALFIFLLCFLSLVWFVIKFEPGPILNNLAFSILAFLNLTLFITFFFFFSRTGGKAFLKKWLGKHVVPLEISYQKILFRRSLKMASLIAAFGSFLIFLKTVELLNIFNLIILLAIILIGAYYLHFRTRT